MSPAGQPAPPDGTPGGAGDARWAARARLVAPVASFRDPLFPGVQRTLPLPPPATVRGLLAAAAGDAVGGWNARPVGYHVAVGGLGSDLETWHPVLRSTVLSRGRVVAGPAGPRPLARGFLTDVRLTLWVPAPDEDAARALADRFRRPARPLRLGRSQDLAFLLAAGAVRLERVPDGAVRRVVAAVAPADAHAHPASLEVGVALTVAADRGSTTRGVLRWCPDASSAAVPVRAAWRDPEDDATVWWV